MFLGIDLGTSGVKALLVDGDEQIVAQGHAALTVSRPHALWSEQDPEDWWQGTVAALGQLRAAAPAAMAAVRGIGLSGQMHGATLLDDRNRVLRPAILWNDGRAMAECAEMERRLPALRAIAGNIAMPGFTAPKLLWVANHEPDIFTRVHKVLLPKDYLRLRLTGDHAAEMSDAAGTLWLDVAGRDWSDDLLAATGLNRRHMPALFEGSTPTGRLRPEIAAACGLPAGAVVAGGAGDNAAGAVGIGAVRPGAGFLSLGTSGVLFVAGDRFAPNPARAVHAFCHCLPGRWHQMAVMLSAASCLDWATRALGFADVGALVAAAAMADADDRTLFLPYLSGERTPHNDPEATGAFLGLTHDTDGPALARAVLEGVAFGAADGLSALLDGDADIETLSVIGGGARSRFWGEILAAALDWPLDYHADGEVGPAFGAARLGRLAATGEDPDALCRRPPVIETIAPDPELAQRYHAKLKRFRSAYRGLSRGC
ncbi:MAG: xylulokinase [Alphaproteobacteria bacterium]|jgi:xylulokinase|nr:xylulokinase [Alphaproteobacteria bacterium]